MKRASKSARPRKRPPEVATSQRTSYAAPLVSLAQLPRRANLSIDLVWVDRMELAVRGDTPVATLRFFSAIATEELVECARLQTSMEHLKAIADAICRATHHYPKPAE